MSLSRRTIADARVKRRRNSLSAVAFLPALQKAVLNEELGSSSRALEEQELSKSPPVVLEQQVGGCYAR